MSAVQGQQRVVIEVAGEDRVDFLQGLVSGDVRRVAQQPVYAAFLTPQGKYLADFILSAHGETILLDVAAPLAGDLLRRLGMYRLRAKVSLTQTDLFVHQGLGPAPEGAILDPRHPDLGWRLYSPEPAAAAQEVDWNAIRVRHCIPESGVELIPNETYILEAGFERLNGVDFRKGCYVGQEVTARMHHKTELRKGFRTVALEGEADFGAEITSGGKSVGQIFTRAGDLAIAYLRFDWAEGEMQAGKARVRLLD